ncbi:flagellar basal body protein FliL [Sphingomonas sp. Leaf412]|uniref:flagellar basal body-associated FliL family protein n=1 Tax=Sphingomonas sp. Leaf412 TaxID=1736370 RepID=UPI0007016F9B|nr:flagellar basal body-associated FliL family protein [Sphingomonas sp. Leaf412]KQT34737.1 flagellar basal body protein FliL [Sphingomonas sp. Leaf412]
MSDTPDAAPAKKKGKMKKILVAVIGVGVLVGGGVGAGLYAAGSGMIGGGAHAGPAEDPNKPKLVPKAEQKHAGEGGEGEGGGDHGGGEGEEAAEGEAKGAPTPAGSGGEKYASNYYAMERDFTSNLQDSAHIVQVGVAVSTPYDDKVITNLKTNDIAVRSAILMALGDTTEDQVFSSEGKKQLQKRLVASINQVLKEKEGFGGIGNVYFTNFVVQ